MKFLGVILFSHIIISCSGKLLIDKAAFIANSVFTEFVSSVVWWHDNPDVTEFIKQYQGCIVVSRLQERNNTIIKKFNKDLAYQQTIFFAVDVDEIEYFMALLNEDLVRPIRLIVILLHPSTYAKVTELMRIAWNYDVADILVLSSESEDVSLTTYFPYGKGKCGDYSPVHLDHNTKMLFPRKFESFHGCEIRVSLLHMSPYSRLTFKNNSVLSIHGIDGDILKMLFEVLNASMKIVSTNDPRGIGTIVNGTAKGLLADLVNKNADIVCPAIILTYSTHAYVQFSRVFESSYIHWFGPKRREISEGLRVLRIFMSDITPILIASCIIFVVFLLAIRRLTSAFASIDNVILNTFSMFLGQQVKLSTKSWFANSLFMFWIWFCVVVRIAYQGVLVNGLQKTILESPLGKFETAVKVINEYGGSENFREFYAGTRYFNDYKVISFRNIPNYLQAVESGQKFLVITDTLMALDSAPKIQMLSNDPVTQPPVVFYMRPGWPAVANINNVLLRMIEFGFTHKVLREFSWEWLRHVASNDDRSAKALPLETLVGCFYVLGFMYAVCTLVLIIEIIYYKRTRGLNNARIFKR